MDDLLRLGKAIGDPNRLRVLRALRRGALNVAELTDVLGIGQSTVSRHLKILTEAGLLAVRRTGTWAYYSLRAANGAFPSRFLEMLASELETEDDADRDAIDAVLARRRRATSHFFRQTARSWDRVRDRALGPPRHLDRLVEWLGRPKTLVDLGTGTGVLLEKASAVARHVIGVDASAEMLEVASERGNGTEEHSRELRLGALEHLPLSDGEADAMVANLVLHHVADIPAVLGEIRRGLAPGGRLVIADLEELEDESFWRSLGAQWPGFRPPELERRLVAAGFERVRWEIQEEDEARDGRPRVFLMQAKRKDTSK